MTTFALDDIVTLKSGDVWRVSSVRTRVSEDVSRAAQAGDNPDHIVIGLDDPANPGKHGTAFNAAVLATLTVSHDTAGRAKVISNLTADLMASGWLWGIGPAETLARRLASLGWQR